MSDIVFTIFAPEDPFNPLTKQPQTMIDSGQWMELEGEGAAIARHVCEDWFDDEVWDEWFGFDDAAVVMVEIVKPAVNRGIYEVFLVKIVKASAQLVKDPRP